MQGTARGCCTVARSSMPCMSIHNHNTAGGRQYKYLVRMCSRGVFQRLLGKLAPMLRARNDARGPVLGSEVIQEPNGVADPVSLLVRQRARIAMKGLRLGRERIGG